MPPFARDMIDSRPPTMFAVTGHIPLTAKQTRWLIRMRDSGASTYVRDSASDLMRQYSVIQEERQSQIILSTRRYSGLTGEMLYRIACDKTNAPVSRFTRSGEEKAIQDRRDSQMARQQRRRP
ncbi:unnamed protein product [Penicillium bialowiezense]